MWLIVPEDRMEELNEINSLFLDRVCSVIETKDGVALTSGDKLFDDYWALYHEFLKGLETYDGVPEWNKDMDD